MEAVNGIVDEKLLALYGNDIKSFSVSWHEQQDAPKSSFQKEKICVGLILEYASWNKIPCNSFLAGAAQRVFQGLDCNVFTAAAQVDYSEETLSQYIGDGERSSENGSTRKKPPGSLPALSLVVVDLKSSQPPVLEWRHVRNVRSFELLEALLSKRINAMQEDEAKNLLVHRYLKTSVDRLADDFHLGVVVKNNEDTLRIFIAGDRSSVGKSSVCLGILGNLLKSGYSPESLAYIKPATQSESTQVVQLYCEKHGVACVPMGPLVYFRGFTRAFLAGETETTDELLEQVARSVDRIARGKRVVLVDGVGFPAVGSICGTDNAAVLRACSYPIASTRNGDETVDRKPMGVVLVGGSGVGAAVDAFNLNATYFTQANVPVMVSAYIVCV
jgi:hypothetical protein